MAFGNETFLYAPNFVPLLVGLVALGVLTRMRPGVLVLASVLLMTNTMKNVGQRMRADAFLDEYEFMRHDVRQAGAVSAAGTLIGGSDEVLKVSVPGAREFDRGSYAMAGTFSPGIDQFSLSFWVTDGTGRLMEGRDVPGQGTDQPVIRGDTVVGMYAETAAYFAYWKAAAARRWQLNVWVRPGDAQVSLVIRSVGPEAGPIRSLEWDGDRLLINDRWVVLPAAPLPAAWLVDEREAGWMTDRPAARRIEVEDGWAAARIDLPGPGRYDFTFEDTQPAAPIDRAIGRIPAYTRTARSASSPGATPPSARAGLNRMPVAGSVPSGGA